MDSLLKFILDKMPSGVIVLNSALETVYRNRAAESFLRRFAPPDELNMLSVRIFDALLSGKLEELFPGEIYVYKQYENSPGRWTFKFAVHAADEPLVCVFFNGDSLSNRVDLNGMRRIYGLTRREVDVLRRVLDGLKNSDIAEDLEIGEQTVKDHLSKIYMKIGVKNRFDLMRSLLNPEEE